MKSTAFLFFFAVSFAASDTSVLLAFAQSVDGDQSVLLDDIRLLGKSVSLPCLQVTPAKLDLAVGLNGTVTVGVPPALIATSPATIKLRSANTNIAILAGAGADGVLALTFAAASSATQTFDVQGVERGQAAVEVVDSAGLCIDNGVDVSVVISFVRNPSFEGNPAGGNPGYGSIDAWTGGSGLNKSAGPFHDNGVIPDRDQVGFLQGSQNLQQQIVNLTPGKQYWLQFRYNVCNSCSGTIDLAVQFDGNEIANIPGITPAGGSNPYYFQQTAFTPGNSGGLLEFVTTATGDATVLLDAINIVERDTGELTIDNPSFEASGTVASPGYIQPRSIAGWTGTGNYGVNVSGVGPFADNGVNPDQDNVAFIQGQGASLSQTVNRLTAGQSYTLSFAVNARGGNAPHLQAGVSGFTLIDENVTPVGGNNGYLVKTVIFTATGADAELRFEQTAGGDNTLLLDNVSIKPRDVTPPPPVALAITLQNGDNVRISWPASATGYLLQSTSSLPGGWVDANLPVTVDPTTGQNFVTVSAASGTKFYRLRK